MAVDLFRGVALHERPVSGVQRDGKAHEAEPQVAELHEPLEDGLRVLAVAHAVHREHQQRRQ